MDIERIVPGIALRRAGIGNMMVAHAKHHRRVRSVKPVDADATLWGEIDARCAFRNLPGGEQPSHTALNKGNEAAAAGKVVLQQERGDASSE